MWRNAASLAAERQPVGRERDLPRAEQHERGKKDKGERGARGEGDGWAGLSWQGRGGGMWVLLLPSFHTRSVGNAVL